MNKSILGVLPPELITKILTLLDYHGLVACRQVCRLFRAAISQNSVLQYTIELAAAGKEDNPRCILDYASRLDTLRKYQDAWRALRWTEVENIDMLQGNLWELSGGVLAQTSRGNTEILFRQLPSRIRKIEQKTWSVSTQELHLRDFTMDPSQDLMVLIACSIPPYQERCLETTIHLRSLQTGNPHPLAVNPPVLRHRKTYLGISRFDFTIQVCKDRVAVHFHTAVDIHNQALPQSDLLVWNWRTGTLLLNVQNRHIGAMSFLNQDYLLIASFEREQVYLMVPCIYALDLRRCGDVQTTNADAPYRCAFAYPSCYGGFIPPLFQIRADPVSLCAPASSNVPFFVGQDARLFIITMCLGAELLPYDSFVLSSTLLAYIERLSPHDDQHHFRWEDWGVYDTRFMCSSLRPSAWVCFVFGTKYVTIMPNSELRPRGTWVLEVWDFNPLADRSPGADPTICVHEPSKVNSGNFLSEIRTRLPYRVTRRSIQPCNPRTDGSMEAMCSEDNIILVDSDARRFMFLTF